MILICSIIVYLLIGLIFKPYETFSFPMSIGAHILWLPMILFLLVVFIIAKITNSSIL